MNNPKLNKLIEKLNDPKMGSFFLSVRDVKTDDYIGRITAEDVKRYGSLEKYLQHLHNTKGVQEVVLDPRKRNGSSSRPCGVPVTLILGNQPATNKNAPAPPPPATVNYPTNNFEPNVPGLMGVGLSQYLDAHSSMRALQKLELDYNDLKSKYEALHAEKERLKDENYDLKREKDKLEDRIERKGPLDGLDINSALPALIGLLKPQNQAPGLNAPAQKQLTGHKEVMRQVVESDGTPDEIAAHLYTTFLHYANGNEKFINEFQGLLKQHSLKPAGNG